MWYDRAMRSFRDDFDDHQLIPGLYGLAERIGEVRHMCPENCVMPHMGQQIPNPFCPVCLGEGTITEERLSRWQMDQGV